MKNLTNMIINKLSSVNGDTAKLRQNASLPEDAYKTMDKEFLSSYQNRLVGVSDLMSAGLNLSLGSNGWAKTQLDVQTLEGDASAIMSMSSKVKGNDSTIDFGIQSLPLPITSSYFEIDARQLASAKSVGVSIDFLAAQEAGRAIAEKVEDTLFNGTSFTYGGNSIPGYKTLTQRTTGSLTASWATATPAQIVADVLDMQQAMLDDYNFGESVLYIPASYAMALEADYSVESGKTVMQRILAIKGIRKVEVSYNIAAEVILVQMDARRNRMVTGLNPTVINWNDHDMISNEFMALAIAVPNVRADAKDRSGIVHFSE